MFVPGASVEDLNTSSETILHIAAKNGQLNIIKLVTEAMGIDRRFINKPAQENSTALIKGKKCVTKQWTALHFACAFGHNYIVKNLLDCGADKNMRTKDKLNAVEVCKAYKQKHLLPLFSERESTPPIASKRAYLNRKVYGQTKQIS